MRRFFVSSSILVVMLIPDPEPTARLSRDLSRLDRLHERLAEEIERPLRYDGPIRRMARAESVEASTSIEGFALPLDEAAAVLRGSATATGSDARLAVAAYGRAMDHVLVLADDPHFSWDLRVLLDLHFDCCAWQTNRSPGRLRAGPIQVTGPGGEARYEGPPAEEVPPLMRELVDYLTAGSGHRVVRGAMTHLHLASIHGFRDGNGRHSRIVQSLVLARHGVLSPEFSSIEPYLAARTRDYYTALAEAQGGAYGRWRTAEGWLGFCLRAHIEQAEKRLALLADAGRRWTTLEALAGERGWPDRLVIALEQAVVTGRLSRTTYAQEADVSPATASADLRRLVDAGLIAQDGRGRSTRYRPSESLRQRLLA